MTMTYGEKMDLKTPVSREEAERVLAKNGIGCGAVMALRFAHTLLATMTELEQVKGERDADKAHVLRLIGLASRATAAEAANAAMTAREGVLRAFIDDFATAKIDALRYQPSYGESPEDEPDPVVGATEVWAWQSDAKDILALKETPDA